MLALIPLAAAGAAVLTALIGDSAVSQCPAQPSVSDLERALEAETRGAEVVSGHGTARTASYGTDGSAPSSSSSACSAAETLLRMEISEVPDYLLLAVLISGATARSSVEVAKEVLARVGGDITKLSGPWAFEGVPGVGAAGWARLVSASELWRRATYRASCEVDLVSTPADAARILSALCTGPAERLSAIYLNRRNRVVGHRLLSIGSPGFTVVDPQMVLRPGIELYAYSIIMAHHHPSGDPTPSSQDIDVTKRVAAAGRVLGLPLLDHLVIGGGGQFRSLAEMGELPLWSEPPLIMR